MIPNRQRHRVAIRGVALSLLAAALGGYLGRAPAQAQQGTTPVQTLPSPAQSGEGSGTLAGSNQFQLVFAAGVSGGPQRRGCVVQNTSSHEQWVYFQGPGMLAPTNGNSATLEASAFPLDPPSGSGKAGSWVSCATGAGGALQDSVWIAGTSGDSFVAKQQ